MVEAGNTRRRVTAYVCRTRARPRLVISFIFSFRSAGIAREMKRIRRRKHVCDPRTRTNFSRTLSRKSRSVLVAAATASRPVAIEIREQHGSLLLIKFSYHTRRVSDEIFNSRALSENPTRSHWLFALLQLHTAKRFYLK